MQKPWVRIIEQLEVLGCLKDMALRPGASKTEIEALEQHIGVALPESLKQFLQIHDGQDGSGLIFGEHFLSVSGIREQWDTWRSIDEVDMNEDCADFMASDPKGFVKAQYCNRAWIPFTHDGGGNHLGIDFDPDDLGTVGQVIAFGRDEDTKRLLAPTFETFVDDYIAWLGHVVWNGKYLDVAQSA